jgi:hypothetical protein
MSRRTRLVREGRPPPWEVRSALRRRLVFPVLRVIVQADGKTTLDDQSLYEAIFFIIFRKTMRFIFLSASCTL